MSIIKDISERNYTKSDLKPGMLVCLRRCEPRIIMPLKDGFCAISKDGYVEYSFNYSEDMKCLPCDGRDIIEIYDVPEYGNDSLTFSPEGRTLLWKRKEVREFSKAEAEIAIAKLLHVTSAEIKVVL